MDVKEALSKISHGQETALDVIHARTENNEPIRRVEVSCKQVPLLPAEPKNRRHTFYDVHGFVEYVNRQAGDRAMVMINSKERNIVAILDERAAGGLENVTLWPLKTPDLATVLDTLGSDARTFAPRDLVLAVQKCSPWIVECGGISAKEMIMLLRQVNVSEKVEVENGIGSGSVNGVMITTTIKGGAVGEQRVEIPEAITVEVPVYLHTSPVKIRFSLLVEAVNKQVRIHVMEMNLDQRINAAFDEIAAKTQMGMKEEIFVGFGRDVYADREMQK